MIATLAEIKLLLGIGDNDSDARINALIPMVEDDILNYTNATFTDPDIYFGGDCTITVAGSVYKLVCADGGMLDSGLLSGDTIYLVGTKRDDGYYTIVDIQDGYIQVNEPITANATEAGLTVKLVTFPHAIKISLARMISYLMKHGDDAGLQSESIKSYSYSRAASGSDSGYPAEILRALDRYRIISTGRSRRREQFIDRRGNYVGQVINPNDIRKGIL